MKKWKKYCVIIVLAILFCGAILYCSCVKIEKSGIDGIYFGMPGVFIEWKEGKPDEKKKTEYGVFRTYENIEILGGTGKITYHNILGLNDIYILYENADDELYQKVSEELLKNYKNRKDFFIENEVVEGTTSTLKFGTNHGATGITVEVTLQKEKLKVSINSSY